MEFAQDDQPVSPTGQYLNSSVLSLTILAVLETEVPVDDSSAMQFLKDTFLPITPRFSSIMVTGENGVKKWKKVDVDLREHINVPTFPSDMCKEYYDECFTEYLSEIAMKQLSPNKPLWEFHIIKYPTKSAAGNVIFKLHHSLGDGYSLMGALLSGLQRFDDPMIPLTFPSRHSSSKSNNEHFLGYIRSVPRFLSGISFTAYDFGWSVLKSSFIEDGKSPIKSGEGVEFRPVVTCTTSFHINQIKEIKSKLNVTVNDVLTGIITYGTRLYMQQADVESGKAKCTALILQNTRIMKGYESATEMVKPNAEMPWGNRFAFLPISLPELTDTELQNPLEFVKNARDVIKRQRNSSAVYLTSQLLELTRKVKGPEATSQYIHGTLKNTSMAISNLIGPVEKMALSGQPIKGVYFVVAGPPQSLSVTVVSYVGQVRVAMTVEKDFIDQNKFKSYIESAFDAIYEAALNCDPLKITNTQ